MFTRLIVVAALAALLWIIWKKLRPLILSLSGQQHDTLSPENNEPKHESLEQDPVTGHYRPVNSKEEKNLD